MDKKLFLALTLLGGTAFAQNRAAVDFDRGVGLQAREWLGMARTFPSPVVSKFGSPVRALVEGFAGADVALLKPEAAAVALRRLKGSGEAILVDSDLNFFLNPPENVPVPITQELIEEAGRGVLSVYWNKKSLGAYAIHQHVFDQGKIALLHYRADESFTPDSHGNDFLRALGRLGSLAPPPDRREFIGHFSALANHPHLGPLAREILEKLIHDQVTIAGRTEAAPLPPSLMAPESNLQERLKALRELQDHGTFREDAAWALLVLLEALKNPDPVLRRETAAALEAFKESSRSAGTLAVFESDLETLRAGHIPSGFLMELGASRWHAVVSFTGKARPYLRLVRSDEPDRRELKFMDMEAGIALAGMGRETKEYLVRLEARSGPSRLDREVIFYSGGKEELRFRYRDLLETIHKNSKKLTPLGPKYAVWLEAEPGSQEARQSLYVLIRRSDGRFVVCVLPLQFFTPGKPVPVYIDGFDLTVEVEPSGRVRIWNTGESPKNRFEAPYFDLEETEHGDNS